MAQTNCYFCNVRLDDSNIAKMKSNLSWVSGRLRTDPLMAPEIAWINIDGIKQDIYLCQKCFDECLSKAGPAFEMAMMLRNGAMNVQ